MHQASDRHGGRKAHAAVSRNIAVCFFYCLSANFLCPLTNHYIPQMETIASTRTPMAVGMRLGHTPAIGRRPGTQPQPELLLIGLRLGHNRPLGLRLGTQRRPLGRRLGLRPLHVGTPLGLRLLG